MQSISEHISVIIQIHADITMKAAECCLCVTCRIRLHVPCTSILQLIKPHISLHSHMRSNTSKMFNTNRIIL